MIGDSVSSLVSFLSVCLASHTELLANCLVGISLHSNVEKALDQGAIVIVPKPVGDETRWECVLVDMSKKDRTAIGSVPRLGGGQITWGVSFFLL